MEDVGKSKLKFEISISSCSQCPFSKYTPDEAIRNGFSTCTYSDFRLKEKFGAGIDERCAAYSTSKFNPEEIDQAKLKTPFQEEFGDQPTAEKHFMWEGVQWALSQLWKPPNGIWHFYAYKSQADYDAKNYYFMKLFSNLEKLKTFSAEHSAKEKPIYPGYCNTYVKELY